MENHKEHDEANLNLLEDYYKRLKAGEDPDPQEYLSRYQGDAIEAFRKGLEVCEKAKELLDKADETLREDQEMLKE